MATILTDVPYEATASNEETFGPLVVVEAVDTPEDAVDVANRTHYGLTSSILAGDTYKAFELAPKLLHGAVNVNSPTFNDEITRRSAASAKAVGAAPAPTAGPTSPTSSGSTPLAASASSRSRAPSVRRLGRLS